MESTYQGLANTSEEMGTIFLLNIINMKVFIGCPSWCGQGRTPWEHSCGASCHGCSPNPVGTRSLPTGGHLVLPDDPDSPLVCERSIGGKVGEAGNGSVPAHPLSLLSGKMTP